MAIFGADLLYDPRTGRGLGGVTVSVRHPTTGAPVAVSTPVVTNAKGYFSRFETVGADASLEHVTLTVEDAVQDAVAVGSTLAVLAPELEARVGALESDSGTSETRAIEAAKVAAAQYLSTAPAVIDAAAFAVDQAIIDEGGITDPVIKAAVTDSDSQTARALAARFAGRTILPATQMRAWGHSFMAGVGPGVNAATQGMARLLADDLLLPLSNKAVGGTALYHHNSAAAHWAVVLGVETRPKSFVPKGGFYPLMYGLNDLNQLGNTVAQIVTFRMALRSVIARLRCSAIFQQDDPSFAYPTGTWQTTAVGSGDAYLTARYTATGGTFTITTPPEFPGGTLVVGLANWSDGGGGVVSTTIGGTTTSVNTTATSRTDARTPAVLRVPDVPAGQATHTFTVGSVTGAIGVMVDYWGWEPPEQTAPLVVLVGQPKPLDYAGYGAGGTNGPPTDAGVDALNTVQQELAAEFGHRVLYVDTSGIDKDPAYWVAGNVHPNAAGHAYIADRVATEVKARASFAALDLTLAGATATAPTTPPAPVPQWQTYVPVLTGAGTAQGDGSWQFANYLRDGDLVHFMVRFLLGSTTTIGSVVEVSLPEPMVSAASAVSLEAEATDQGTGFFSLRPRPAASADKVVLWYAPGSGVWQVVKDAIPFLWTTNDSFDVRGTYRAWPL